jgi:hypothetical protein
MRFFAKRLGMGFSANNWKGLGEALGEDLKIFVARHHRYLLDFI